MNDRSSIVSRIRKLLALGQSPNQHEAMLAMQRASELMEKHQIAMSDVDVEDVKRSGIIREDYNVQGLKMKLHWVVTLANACARLFDGTICYDGSQLHGTRVTFIGTPEDLPLMKALFEHLYPSWHSIVEADLKVAKAQFNADNTYRTWAPKDTMKFKAGHGLMYANAIYSRVSKLVNERKARVQETSTGTALVVLKDQMLMEATQDLKPKRVQASSGSNMGRQAGWRRGQQATLGGAIGHG